MAEGPEKGDVVGYLQDTADDEGQGGVTGGEEGACYGGACGGGEAARDGGDAGGGGAFFGGDDGHDVRRARGHIHLRERGADEQKREGKFECGGDGCSN